MGIQFSDWLTQQLAEKNMSQAELARKSGLTRQSISYYLSAKSKQPDEFALEKIAAGLELPVEQVYRAAGIKLSPKIFDEETEQLISEYESLSGEDQKRVLAFARMLNRLFPPKKKK